MQGIVFARRLRHVLARLRVAEMVELFFQQLERPPGQDLPEGFKTSVGKLSFSMNAVLVNENWRPIDRQILESFQLHETLSGEGLQLLVKRVNAAKTPAGLWQDGVINAFYTRVSSLVGVGSLVADVLESERLPKLNDDEAVLELLIYDYGEGPIPASRLAKALESVERLTDLVARLHGVSIQPLRVAVVDSGSDVVLFVMGLSVVMHHTRGILSEVVNWIRFNANERAERNMETVAESLKTFESIAAARKAGALDELEAKTLRHATLTEVNKVIGLGVAPIELDDLSVASAEELLLQRRDQRLLGSGPMDEENQHTGDGN